MIKVERFSVNPKGNFGRNKQLEEFEDFLNKIGEARIIQILACSEAVIMTSGMLTTYTVIYRA